VARDPLAQEIGALAYHFHWTPETIAGMTELQRAGFLTWLEWHSEEMSRAARE